MAWRGAEGVISPRVPYLDTSTTALRPEDGVLSDRQIQPTADSAFLYNYGPLTPLFYDSIT